MASTFQLVTTSVVSQEDFFLKAKATVKRRGMCVGNQMALAIKNKRDGTWPSNKKQFVPVGFRFQTKEERQKSKHPMANPI